MKSPSQWPGSVRAAMHEPQVLGHRVAFSQGSTTAIPGGLALAQRLDQRLLQRPARIRVDRRVNGFVADAPLRAMGMHTRQLAGDLLRRPAGSFPDAGSDQQIVFFAQHRHLRARQSRPGPSPMPGAAGYAGLAAAS
jgi:hypothetical protein